MAHSTKEKNYGLVLVSDVGGNAAKHTSIQVRDIVVGVSCKAADFKQSTTGFDYEATMDAIVQAKTQAELLGESTISLQLNRMVPRAPVLVTVENSSGAEEVAVMEGLAGDNLRLLLKQNNVYFSSSDCGGEGMCGTCAVKIVDGLDSIGSLDSASCTKVRRKACQTVVGADNQKSDLRIRLHSTVEHEQGDGDQ
jgi:ferredoxin